MFLGQADSGWRKIDERRVKELHETFLQGDYGLNIQRKPALVKFAHESTDHAVCSDGKARLADGKHTFTAMSRIWAVFRENKGEVPDGQEWSPALVDALQTGVDVMIAEYEDEDHAQFHNVAARDAENNKFQATPMRDLCEVAWKRQKKVAGGDWKTTQKELEEAYGNKTTWVYRMVRAAQCLSEATLDALAENQIPNHLGA